MKRHLLGAVALTVAMAFGAAYSADAKTFIYCSEGSPENFNPQINTTGTSFDAAYPVFNRLVEFKPGTTTIIPALAEKWSVSDDGLTYTFHLRKGVKFHSNKSFKPTRDFDADDVIVTFNRMWKPDDPYAKVSGGAYDYFNDMGMPDLLQSIDKVDDYTVKITLKKPNAPFIANLAMDFAAIHSTEYMDAMLKAGTPEMVDQTADRHRALRVRQLREGRGHPLQGLPRLFPGQAEDRQPRLRHHPRRRRAHGQAQGGRMRPRPLSEPGRPAEADGRQEAQGRASGRPQRRLSRLQYARSRPSTRRRSARP